MIKKLKRKKCTKFKSMASPEFELALPESPVSDGRFLYLKHFSPT